MVNSLTSKLQIGAPFAASYVLDYPDHYTNFKFKVFGWRAYVNEVLKAWPQKSQTEQPSDEDVQVFAPNNEDIDGDNEKVTLVRGEANILGSTRVDDYIYRPRRFENVSLYDWMQMCERRKRPKKNPPKFVTELDMSSIAQLVQPFDKTDMTDIECAKSTTAHRFLSGHPLAATHYVECDERKLEDTALVFTYGHLPRQDQGDREFYCTTMLTLFRPWRSGHDLKSELDSWHETFMEYKFTAKHLKLMDNFNIKYECNDARDDYAAQDRKLRRAIPGHWENDVEGWMHNCDDAYPSDESGIEPDPDSSETVIGDGEKYRARSKVMREAESIMSDSGWVKGLRWLEELPQDVRGLNRREILANFHAWKGRNYEVPGLHQYLRGHGAFPPAIKYTKHDEPVGWKLVGSDVPARRKTGSELSNPALPALHGSAKRKADEATDAGLSKRARNYESIPAGLSWDNRNWSCAYDSLFSVLLDVWTQDRCAWPENSSNKYLRKLFEGLGQHKQSGRNLLAVRDDVRSMLFEDAQELFPWGAALIAVNDLASQMFGSDVYGSSADVCDRCHVEWGAIDSDFLCIQHLTAGECAALPAPTVGTAAWLSSIWRRASRHDCPVCESPNSATITVHSPPPMLYIASYSERVRADVALTVPVAGGVSGYSIRGVIYFASAHFTSRIIRADGGVWLYDGMVDGGRPRFEGALEDMPLGFLDSHAEGGAPTSRTFPHSRLRPMDSNAFAGLSEELQALLDHSGGVNPMILWPRFVHYDDWKLFHVALYSQSMSTAVYDFLAAHQRPPQDAVTAQDQVDWFFHPDVRVRLPVEVWWMILDVLDVVSAKRMQSAYPQLTSGIDGAISRKTERAFGAVGIDLARLRFALVQTRSVVGSHAGARLLNPDADAFAGLDVLEIFVPKGSANVLRQFFDVSLDFMEVSHPGLERHRLRRRNGVSGTVFLQRRLAPPGSIVVALHSCPMPPRSTVFRSALSSQFISYDGVSLVVPHASLATRDLAVPNLAFTTNDDVDGWVGYEKNALQNGFRIRRLAAEYLVSPQTFLPQGTDYAPLALTASKRLKSDPPPLIPSSSPGLSLMSSCIAIGYFPLTGGTRISQYNAQKGITTQHTLYASSIKTASNEALPATLRTFGGTNSIPDNTLMYAVAKMFAPVGAAAVVELEPIASYIIAGDPNSAGYEASVPECPTFIIGVGNVVSQAIPMPPTAKTFVLNMTEYVGSAMKQFNLIAFFPATNRWNNISVPPTAACLQFTGFATGRAQDGTLQISIEHVALNLGPHILPTTNPIGNSPVGASPGTPARRKYVAISSLPGPAPSTPVAGPSTVPVTYAYIFVCYLRSLNFSASPVSGPSTPTPVISAKKRGKRRAPPSDESEIDGEDEAEDEEVMGKGKRKRKARILG
uniref:Uncharacterized protein n=1 Tax=Mycena chlorophos TaxID=658473 RepID=A0ABQ0L0L2_MYCCL|nr:predicted protein [Mycena chlorophos]